MKTMAMNMMVKLVVNNIANMVVVNVTNPD